MSKAIFLSIVCILLSFLTACNEKSTEPNNETTKTILPLAEGNRWNYKFYNETLDSLGAADWEINRKVIVDSEEYYLIETTGFGSGYYLAKQQSDGLLLSAYDSTEGFISPFFFKYPANDNDTYQYQISGTDSILSITVKKQNILIGNENYSCYAYINHNLEANPNNPFMYFAENIGLIRHKLFYNTVNRIDTTKYIIYDLQSKIVNN